MANPTADDNSKPAAAGSEAGRLILVSNRLPITIKRSDDGEYTFKKSSGGLVSGISGLIKTTEFLWYGWPGVELPEDEAAMVEQRLKNEQSAVPVLFDDELADKHYNGFSNEILWALLHYHPGEITFDESAWSAYKQVNQLFADRICEDVRDNDIVWVHDYHLMLLPSMIRDNLRGKRIRVKIGWFLHTPFPSSEIFRVLPVRSELLEGILQADLIGFHTYDYTRHFLSSCNRLLGASTTPNTVDFQGRRSHVGAFPIGIDPEQFYEGLKKEKTQERIKFFQDRFRDTKLIIGCDRLDYIKGIPHKLHTFEYFLETHPEWVGKVQLVQIAIPSREDVEEYQALRRNVNELVGQINGRFGTIDFNPVHLKHTSVTQEDLMALYAISDVCLVSSTRDGMNLVAYEYIACQGDRHGMLVLSEFAGCAQNFASGAILCNPYNIEELSAGIYEAVTMSDADRKNNHERLAKYVSKYTSWWGESFIEELTRVTDDSSESKTRIRRQTVSRPRIQGVNEDRENMEQTMLTKPGAKVAFEMASRYAANL